MLKKTVDLDIGFIICKLDNCEIALLPFKYILFHKYTLKLSKQHLFTIHEIVDVDHNIVILQCRWPHPVI